MADDRQLAAKKFVAYWTGKGSEKSQSQSFWLSLLRDVYGVAQPEQMIEFEDEVHLDNASFIDALIPSTRVMIEQKGLGKDLNKAIRQSDGTLLTPFQQAKRYITELPVSRHPRWVVTCNFEAFYVYDMERPGGDPEIILLKNLEQEYYRLAFLVDSGNEHTEMENQVSIDAGRLVGQLYDAFARRYDDPDDAYVRHSLNVLCVRLVFCLYAENGGIFGHYGMFHDYLESFSTQQTRKALEDLFVVLDTPPEKRPRHLEDDNPSLAAFPYVNGGLFADEDVDIPPFTDEIRDLLLQKASAGFNWRQISPTIFGAVFESTLNPETRRSGGMHYTSVENIHKVIDPLFLDDLTAEFDEIRAIAVEKTRNKRLTEFQEKLASLTFLDPACGSGNFLTESYLSLRRLENDVLRELQHGQMSLGFEGASPIKVSLDQFYGIEINDFAVSVAMTALWIAESQMMQETEEIVAARLEFLPLKSYSNIAEGNALRMDWNNVVPREKLDYIMGNPPFVGARIMSAEQKQDINDVFPGWKNAGNLDYVSGWYKKSAEMMQGTDIRAALVSTNSVSQGETVANLWKPLFDAGVHIDFAHRTFRWDSEAKIKAHVHCVIIGFSTSPNKKDKLIYTDGRPIKANNINGYLFDGENIFITNRKHPICDVPEMVFGNTPIDDGNFMIEANELGSFLCMEPKAKPYIRKIVGSREFINNLDRYCLWLVGVSPVELHQMPFVMKRVQAIYEMRMNSKREATVKLADTPTLFGEIRQPNEGDYLLVPLTSSQRRRYIPIGFMSHEVIATNLVQMLPNATKYHFGILTSNVSNSWMRTVCGRLKSDYRYTISNVYNNFPWPTPTDAQRERIEQTAQAILDARALYPDSSLADLYDELTMPPELRKAHQANDKAVMDAYGFTKGTEAYASEAACVAALMKRYQELTQDE